MNILNQDEFKILERHKNFDIKFISALEVNKNDKLIFENVSLTDFTQGKIANCGLIAVLAAISQRPEFLSKIAPKIEQTSEGMKFHFKMILKGKPIVVTVDDKLPYELLDDKISLIYAKSGNGDNLYLASLFEKAVVKLVCNSNYNKSEGILPYYAFSLFSDCMVGCYFMRKTDSKQDVIDLLKYEVDNKSSVVLAVSPDVMYKPEISKRGHAYVVMDYNLEHKAIKLYGRRERTNYFTNFETNLPLSITETADPNKMELWITLDQLEKRRLSIHSLYSKNMYSSVFKINKTLKQVTYDRDYSYVSFACKVDIKQASTFMTNIFSFSHEAEDFTLNVCTADDKKQNVKFIDEVPQPILYNENLVYGEAKSIYFQRFKLQPNQYIFEFETVFRKINNENADLLLKIGSVSECSFEEVVEEIKN